MSRGFKIEVQKRRQFWGPPCRPGNYKRRVGKAQGPALRLAQSNARESQGSRQVLLLLDLAPCHLHDSLFDLAYSLGLRLLFVPPGMTSLLQPCDTHIFAAFKHNVQESWRRRRAAAPDGQVSLELWRIPCGVLSPNHHPRTQLRSMPGKRSWEKTLVAQQHLGQKLLDFRIMGDSANVCGPGFESLRFNFIHRGTLSNNCPRQRAPVKPNAGLIHVDN